MTKTSTTTKSFQVVHKWTYLFLLAIPIGAAMFGYTLTAEALYLGDLLVSVLIMLVGAYLFVRFNTRSYLMNPNHPR